MVLVIANRAGRRTPGPAADCGGGMLDLGPGPWPVFGSPRPALAMTLGVCVAVPLPIPDPGGHGR